MRAAVSHLVREVTHHKHDSLSDMASIEEKLSFMSGDSALSSDAGGIIGHFFLYA